MKKLLLLLSLIPQCIAAQGLHFHLSGQIFSSGVDSIMRLLLSIQTDPLIFRAPSRVLTITYCESDKTTYMSSLETPQKSKFLVTAET
jgi:hypothetical protein